MNRHPPQILFVILLTIAHSGFEPSASPGPFGGELSLLLQCAPRLVNHSKRSVLYFSYCPETSYCVFVFICPAGLQIYSGFTRSSTHMPQVGIEPTPFGFSDRRSRPPKLLRLKVSLKLYKGIFFFTLTKSCLHFGFLSVVYCLHYLLKQLFKFLCKSVLLIYPHRSGACSEQ